MVNKLFVMLPVMYAARKIDQEDEEKVLLLRYAYFFLHALMIMSIGYIYACANKFEKTAYAKRQILIALVPGFGEPDAAMAKGKKYKSVVMGEHILQNVKQLLSSTIFSICLTTGLHFYKGMITGMAIQIVMGPFNLFENPLFRLFVLGYKPDSRVFDEKNSKDELEADDVIVDEDGKTIYPSSGKAKISADGSLEEILLDTWDANEKADITVLMEKLNKENINSVTKEHKWTPLMVMSGMMCKGTASALRQMKQYGADPEMIDTEGWNALHWSCFHGSAEAAKVIVSIAGFDGISIGLHNMKDKDGKTPLDLAKSGKNNDVAKIVSDAISSSETKKSK